MAALEQIVRFLEIGSALPAELLTPQPLTRTVQARRSAWTGWLSGHRTIAGRPLAIDPQRTVASLQTVNDPRMTLAPPEQGRDLRVSRADLIAIGQQCAQTDSWIPLWVAVMIWGSGTSNGRGPMNTARGLSDPQLDELLDSSAALVCAGQLPQAWNTMARLQGSGEPFFSKWLWAASLAVEAPSSAFILDGRVRTTLQRLGIRPGHNATGYDDFTRRLARWAQVLQARDWPHLTGEKLEFLLFHRCSKPHPPRCTNCLYGWLGTPTS